jgi:tetratricopeptide (TPR) repeat protein
MMNRIWLSAIATAIMLVGCGRANYPPAPPPWLNAMSATPEWWSGVAVDYNPADPKSNCWTYVWAAEERIKEDVKRGISPMADRQSLIKYKTLFSDHRDLRPSSRRGLKADIASLYRLLGDHKRAIRELTECMDRPYDPFLLRDLALEYEIIGEREQALKIYTFIGKECKNRQSGPEIAQSGIAALKGINRDCLLKKPVWWDEYQNPPTWWTNVSVELPSFSSFQDGRDFIVSNMLKDPDGRKLVKAWILQSNFKPMSFLEKIQAQTGIAVAYSRIGDHHRAIESKWKVLDELAYDPSFNAIALKFIASEFEKLGEPDQAKEMLSMLPCFSDDNGPRKSK